MTLRTTLRLLFGLFLLIGLTVFIGVWLLPLQPVKLTHATITDIANNAGRYGRTVTVMFRTDDGLVGWDKLPANIVDCEVGDVVPASRQGVTISLQGRACRKRQL